MAPQTKHPFDTENVVGRLSGYLDKLFSGAEKVSERMKDRVAERVADRVAPKVAARLTELEAYIATMEVLVDDEALDDLRASSRDSDSELRDYDDLRREVGLA
jgi:hypothetical protein